MQSSSQMCSVPFKRVPQNTSELLQGARWSFNTTDCRASPESRPEDMGFSPHSSGPRPMSGQVPCEDKSGLRKNPTSLEPGTRLAILHLGVLRRPARRPRRLSCQRCWTQQPRPTVRGQPGSGGPQPSCVWARFSTESSLPSPDSTGPCSSERRHRAPG